MTRVRVCVQAGARQEALESPVLLLELPQLGVDVKRPSEVGLPLLVSILRQVSANRSKLLEL